MKKIVHCFLDNTRIDSFNMNYTKKELAKKWPDVMLFFNVMNKSKDGSYNFIKRIPLNTLTSYMALYAFVSSMEKRSKAKEIAIHLSKDKSNSKKVLIEWGELEKSLIS